MTSRFEFLVPMKENDIEILTEHIVPTKKHKSSDGSAKYIALRSNDNHMEGNGRTKLYGKSKREVTRPSTAAGLDGSYLKSATLPNSSNNHRKEKLKVKETQAQKDGRDVTSHRTQRKSNLGSTTHTTRNPDTSGFYPTFHRLPDKSVGGKIFSGNLTHRVHRQSPTLSYIRPRQYTVQESVRLEEKAIYQSLLQQFTSIPCNSLYSLSQPSPTQTSPYGDKSNETELGSYVAPPTPPIREKDTVPVRFKVKPKVAEPREGQSERHDLSVGLLTPAPVNERSVHPRVDIPPQPDFQNDSPSITKVRLPDSVVQRSTLSARKKTPQSVYSSEDWVKQLKAKYDSAARERIRQIEELEIKLKICEERRHKNEARLEEQIRERMRISEKEPAVIEDVTVTEEEFERLPELTEEMENEIDAAFVRNPEQEVLSEGFRLSVTRADIHTLHGLNWLNDEVINFYMNLLMDRGQKQGNLKVHAFNTFFYPKLIKDGYTSLRRWTRKVDVFSMDLVAVPIHLGMHWCLAVIDFRHKTITYYDSMGGSNHKCLNALREYLRSEHKDKKKSEYDLSGWNFECAKDIPQQMNGSDCGMFACKYAEYIARDANLTFSQDDMPYFRRRMVWEILHKQLL